MAPFHRICRLAVLSLLWIASAGAISEAPIAPSVALSAELAAVARGERVSLDQAVTMVLGRYGGKVISADTSSRNGRVVHRIKLLTDDGRVRTVRVDGQTGNIS